MGKTQLRVQQRLVFAMLMALLQGWQCQSISQIVWMKRSILWLSWLLPLAPAARHSFHLFSQYLDIYRIGVNILELLHNGFGDPLTSCSAIVRMTFLVWKWKQSVSTPTGRIASKFGIDVNVSLRMSCNSFGDSLAFLSGATWVWCLWKMAAMVSLQIMLIC